jgi:uncharacterized protein (UPF0147 family)
MNVSSQLPIPEDRSKIPAKETKPEKPEQKTVKEKAKKTLDDKENVAGSPLSQRKVTQHTKPAPGIRQIQEMLTPKEKEREAQPPPGREEVKRRAEAYSEAAAREGTVERTPVETRPGAVSDAKVELRQASEEKDVEKTHAEVEAGLVESKKGELGLKLPAHRLGESHYVNADEVEKHRHPDPSLSKYSDHALTEKHMEEKLAELTSIFSAQEGREPKLHELAKLKEQAAQWTYDHHINANISKGYYDPKAIPTEIKIVLGVGDEIPSGVVDQETAMAAISEELDRFNIPTFEAGRKQSQVLTNELRKHLEEDIKETMRQYKEVYPEKSWEHAYVFCRDLGRAAVYQVIFDKASFTGSDHGVLHIHHNTANGEHMHHHMDEGDMTPRARLLARVMHFYHDIGYSVGETSFPAKKDHPFIGAAFIDANRGYFDHYLGSDATDIIQKSILYHAIVSFESDVGDDLSMVRFTTSNSDACAVTADQKTQSFWREHPETLKSLARLRHFLMTYPEYAGRSKLSSMDIIKHPEKVFKLKVERNPPDLSEANFFYPLDFKAWKIFSTVRDELISVAMHQQIPHEEKRAFVEAIEANFNAFSGDIVLAQYGAELREVSVAKNPDAAGPKYLPSIDISPSVLFLFLQSAFDGIAGENLRKVLNKEYGAQLEDIDRILDDVGTGKADQAIVPSEYARLVITKQEKIEVSKKLRSVVATLEQIERIRVPHEIRREVNKVVDALNQVSKGADLTIFIDAYTNLFDELDPTSELTTGLRQLFVDITAKLSTKTKLSEAEYNQVILDIRTKCSTPEELRIFE